MSSLRVAASAVEISADDRMVIGGSILPSYTQCQEAPLRAAAVVIEADMKLCIVSCDVLAIGRDIADAAAQRIEAEFGIPFANILITATHTHHAPSTFTVHAYEREEQFCRNIGETIFEAVGQAVRHLADESVGPNDKEAEFGFVVGNEATWGANSRVQLKDGTIGWYGFDYAEIARPTGPFDPDLPLIAFLRPGGGLAAAIFNHSTHNIGATGPGRSPAVYGLTAQAAETRHGGTVLFAPGAFGSSHNMGLPAAEGIERLRERAAAEGLSNVRAMVADASKSLPLDAASVDTCLLATVLHDLKREGAAEGTLSEITRVLKPGGRLVVVEFEKVDGPPGPPKAIRLATEETAAMVEPHGLSAGGTVDIGHYAYLIVFRKPVHG